jgi:hypothetical protein
VSRWPLDLRSFSSTGARGDPGRRLLNINPTGGASETPATATAGVSAAYRACRSKSKLSQRMNRDDA